MYLMSASKRMHGMSMTASKHVPGFLCVLTASEQRSIA